ncbi:cytochrome oxidase [Natrarchaeobaculum aegyptiacum]|uniref:Cytochrome oxidase n=1 Tax=Natrarchaeobaculum aegyptiacum TaxID=745377 RepID=A0A2Z2HWY6_9EURY|nr:cytochrome oxidase [Natrarchaeobaculum aegyptiacum]ARS91886.1 cytochrome oxidase [Natrarchaeobaculum aegyptiacum]
MTDGNVTREIDHDEYDPVGTLALIVLYFVILLLMWGFTYFIEFLGNDPTPMLLA